MWTDPTSPSWQRDSCRALIGRESFIFCANPRNSVCPLWLVGRIKETLRLWTPQAFIERDVRRPITLPAATLTTRDSYVLSPYLQHRDPRYWRDPETFDPDRWRPDARRTGASYLPFGWSPRACVGARLALSHLICTRYRIAVARPDAVTITLHSGPVPTAPTPWHCGASADRPAMRTIQGRWLSGKVSMDLWLQLASTMLVGLLTAGGALVGVRMNGRVGDRATEQREIQGRREEWSKRFYEILAYVVDESPRKRAAGLHLMSALAESDLAGPDEIKLMEILTDRVLNPLLHELEQRQESSDD